MTRHPPGTTGTIIDGVFADFTATVIEHADRMQLHVEIFGRVTEISVALEQFEADDEQTGLQPLRRRRHAFGRGPRINPDLSPKI